MIAVSVKSAESRTRVLVKTSRRAAVSGWSRGHHSSCPRQHQPHLPSATWCELCVMARALDTPHAMSKTKSDEEFTVCACEFSFIKTGGDYGPTEDELAANAVAVDADTWNIKIIPCSPKGTSDCVLKMLRKFLVVQMQEGKMRR